MQQLHVFVFYKHYLIREGASAVKVQQLHVFQLHVIVFYKHYLVHERENNEILEIRVEV